MLYIISLGLIYFITGSLYLLTTFTHFAHPHASAPSNYQSVLCIYEFGFLFLFLDSTYKWDHVVFVFLCLTDFT